MSHYAIFEGRDGQVVAAEVEESDSGEVLAGESDMGMFRKVSVPDDAGASDIRAALPGLRATLSQVVDELKELGPDELKVDVGVKLSAQVGVAVAKGTSEGHFVVSMTWRRGRLT